VRLALWENGSFLAFAERTEHILVWTLKQKLETERQ